MKPRPQGAFPWLWRWDSKAREKSPANEVGESRLSIGDGEQLCQDECKKQVFSSNCNVSFKVLSDVLAVKTEQHYCFAVSSTWSMFFYKQVSKYCY